MTRRANRIAIALRRVPLIAAFGFLLGVHGLAGQSEDEQSLRDHFDRMNEAFKANDTDALMSMYADNMVRIPPGEPVVVGLDALREGLDASQAEFDYVLDEYEVRRVDVSGDLGYILATYSEHFTPRAGGETTSQSGRWATMWRRQDDGSWKCTAEIWNLDPAED